MPPITRKPRMKVCYTLNTRQFILWKWAQWSFDVSYYMDDKCDNANRFMLQKGKMLNHLCIQSYSDDICLHISFVHGAVPMEQCVSKRIVAIVAKTNPGPLSLSRWTSYHNMLWGHEAARFYVMLIVWASYQIGKTTGCARAGNAGNGFPATAG